MERKLLLAYDASVDWHYSEEKDFRRSLVEFLLKYGATELKSYVSSTIEITVPNLEDKIRPSSLKKALASEFVHMNFVVCLTTSTINNNKRQNWIKNSESKKN